MTEDLTSPMFPKLSCNTWKAERPVDGEDLCEPRARCRARVAGAAVLVAAIFAMFPGSAHAYIGPGAGFALISSFFAIFLAFLFAFVLILTWPIRYLFVGLKRKRAYARSRAERMIIVGLDGLDPKIVDRLISEGKLPNFARLKESGTYSRLKTTCPALSPVAVHRSAGSGEVTRPSSGSVTQLPLSAAPAGCAARPARPH